MPNLRQMCQIESNFVAGSMVPNRPFVSADKSGIESRIFGGAKTDKGFRLCLARTLRVPEFHACNELHGVQSANELGKNSFVCGVFRWSDRAAL
jgi:predicted nucleic acid binding AN1-type Zn finger protein